MTGYDPTKHNFTEKYLSLKTVKVTNNLGRAVEQNELVYLGGYFGNAIEAIADGAEGYINIDHEREISTEQIEATDTFTVDRVLHFVSGGSSAAGKLVDTQETGSVPVGTITAEQGTGGAQTSVQFKPYPQGGEGKPGRVVQTVKTVISADATAGKAVDIPFGAEIKDMMVIGTAASSGGTVTLKTGAGTPATLATALAMAADGTVARLAAGVVHGSLVVGADGIKLFAGQAADRGIVWIDYVL